MQLLQSLSTKANVWHEKYGIAAKNLAKISVKTLIPGLGELLADGIDSIFEITDHKDHVKWNDQIDQHLATIQADQQQYLQLLETIESQIGSLLSEIAREFQTQMQTQTQSQTQSQELILKSLFDQSFSRNELQFIQLQQSLSGYTQNFQIVEQKLDGLYRKQIELAIDLKEGNNSLNDSIQALKNLYQDLSLQIQDKQRAHIKNQDFRDFLVEIEHELLHHNPNRAKVILENAFIQKTIDLQFKQLYECKINALQGHLSQIEDLLEKSKELENLRGLINIKEQVKNASRWMTSHEKYRTFLHQSGKKIGDKGWQLDIPIGIGGMGEVWKAHNLKGEEGAIKFVHEELLMDQFAKKKFFDEVDSLTRLKHPNIVSLKDWGIENGSNQLYLVMDYVDGETMRQLINRKNYLTWAEAKVIFLDLVEALYVCHQANIIHKDIKPDNIVLRKNPKNQPILIDFGIANIRPISVSTRTKTKHIVGSDLYMSPEQKSGGHLTDKTDIYSLGITLLEVLTGKCAIDEKLDDQSIEASALDLIDFHMLISVRNRYNSLQLFEKLGGDLQRLKGKNQDQNELMQLNLNYQNLENEKNVIESKLKESELIIQMKDQLILRMKIEQDELKKQIHHLNSIISTPIVSTPIVSTPIVSTPIVSTPIANTPIASDPTKHLKNIVVKGVEFKMIECLAGDFWMGSKEDLGYDIEKPRHQVVMRKNFLIGETLVTQKLWKEIMGWNASKFQGSNDLPVENITWYDCLVFCNKLSELDQKEACFSFKHVEMAGFHMKKANVEWKKDANGYRLPTEAEWEYAAKAGSDLIYSGSNDIDQVAWYNDNSKIKTHDVKLKMPNAWGLYDMSGNVWESCMDHWDINDYKNRPPKIENPIIWKSDHCVRVVRGGSYGYNADRCRMTYRFGNDADYRGGMRGFRLLATLK